MRYLSSAWLLPVIAGLFMSGAVVVLREDDARGEEQPSVSSHVTLLPDSHSRGPSPVATPALAPLPAFRADPSRPVVRLNDEVLARPIVDEYGAPGIEIFDIETEASYGWVPGRGAAIFQGHADAVPGCSDCQRFDGGWMRVMQFAIDEQGLRRLIAREPVEDPSRPTGPPSSPSAVSQCSGGPPKCPTPALPTP